jgi:hypothetical protein
LLKYLIIPTYSFPADYYALTNLVALFKQTIKAPVTFGSSVPEWPVFSTFKILFIHDTTSWDDGLDGLSKLITPYLRCSTRFLFKGVYGRIKKLLLIHLELEYNVRSKHSCFHSFWATKAILWNLILVLSVKA